MIDWSRRTYSKEEFTEAWGSASSIRDVANRLGKCKSGRGYYVIKSAAHDLGLNEDHMGSKQHRAYANRSRPLSDILVKDSDYTNTDRLRKRLVKEGLLEKRCYAPFCPFADRTVLDPFSGGPVGLRLCLDHINGNNKDNRLDNLRILCYHCHAMTPTFGSKNKSV